MKIILSLAVLAVSILVVAPVMAATQWSFGASLRYATFWTERDGGRHGISDLQGGGGVLGQDSYLDWSTQGNSRIKMAMKSDHLEGYIEMGYNFDKNSLTTREYWGKYKFGDKAYIAIGQQHQLFRQLISNQVWGSDLNMNGLGAAYKSPTPKITLGYGGFAFALAKPYDGRVSIMHAQAVQKLYALVTVGPGGTEDVVTDADNYFPQVQASYQYQADTWRIKLAGAYQYLKMDNLRATYIAPSYNFLYTIGDENIHSWLLGLDGDINFGPLYLAAAASVGQNWSDAGWNDESSGISDIWTNDYLRSYMGVAAKVNFANVHIGGGHVHASWRNTTSAMLSLVAAYQLQENLRFELGGGYRYDDNSIFEKSGSIFNVYLQAAYVVAPGFSVTPEIGYIDLGENVMSGRDQGYLWYAGAKWQMDF